MPSRQEATVATTASSRLTQRLSMKGWYSKMRANHLNDQPGIGKAA